MHLFLTSLLLCWAALSKVDFFYSLWYDALEIDQLIDRTGPRHRYKQHFELTDKAEHVRLFSEINRSVHRNGEGLASITYHTPDGKRVDTMLTRDEIVHLQDVAHLIDLLRTAGWGTTGITLGLGMLIVLFRVKKPKASTLLKITAGVIGAAAVILVIVGPVNLFYQLHDWIFPKEHPWFFYYEDSLMTMMMYAPYLFGYISGLLFLCTLIMTTVFILITQKLQSYSNPNSTA